MSKLYEPTLIVPELTSIPDGASSWSTINTLKEEAERQGANMFPNPLLMLMKGMTQRPHGPRPYDGILSAREEMVVRTSAEAETWIETTYKGGERATLIEIKVLWDLMT